MARRASAASASRASTPDNLARYRAKRDFTLTAEPAGATLPTGGMASSSRITCRDAAPL